MRGEKRWWIAALMLGVAMGLAGGCTAENPVNVAEDPLIAEEVAEAPYRRVQNWPQLPAGMELANVAGVAVDAEDIIYAFQRGSLPGVPAAGTNEIWMFDRSGAFLGVWGPSADPGFVKAAHALHIDAEGFFWVVDRDGHQVKKFHADGTLLMTVGTGDFGNTPDTFNGPTTVAFLDDGDFVVSHGYWNSRLVWFNAEGKFLKQLGGEYGRGPGKLGGGARGGPGCSRPAARGRSLLRRVAADGDTAWTGGRASCHRVRRDHGRLDSALRPRG